MNADLNISHRETTEPSLIKSDEGIGFVEMSILKGFVKPILMSGLTKESVIQKMTDGEARLEKLLLEAGTVNLTQRILVERPWFVEHSSRYWSAAMLFRHLAKVNTSLAKAMEYKINLGAETADKAKQRLKAVKPEVESNTENEIEMFRKANKRLIAALESVSEEEFHTLKIPHPWFGELTYAQWGWFCGFHMGIHAPQLKEIFLRQAWL